MLPVIFGHEYDEYLIISRSNNGETIKTIVDDCPEEVMAELAALDKGFYKRYHDHLYTNFEHIDYDDDEQDK